MLQQTFPEEEQFTFSKYWIYQVLSSQYLLCWDPYLQFSFFKSLYFLIYRNVPDSLLSHMHFTDS